MTPLETVKKKCDKSVSRVMFYETLCGTEEPIFKVYATKNVKRKRYYKLVQVKTLDKTIESTDLYYTWMSGYNVIMGAEVKYLSYYGEYKETNRMYKVDKASNPSVIRLWDVEDLRKFKGFEYITSVPFETIDYLNRWLKYEDLELYAKAGLEYVWSDSRFLTLKGAKRKAMLSYIKSNLDEIRRTRLQYNILINLATSNISLEEYNYECLLKKVTETLENGDTKGLVTDFQSVTKYIMKNGISVGMYRDYVSMSNELGRFNEDTVMPKDFRTAHDMVSATLKAKREKAVEDGMRNYSSQFKALTKNGISAIVASSTEQLVEAGNKLSICVGSYGYNKKMANGECLIVILYQGGEPLECCELVPKRTRYAINQLRGSHNQDSEYHSECKEIMDMFVKKYQVATI